jgi:hypothetical protein
MVEFYSLTHAQKAIWNVEKFASGTGINNITGTLRFGEELSFTLLEQAVNSLIKKTMQFGPVLEF